MTIALETARRIVAHPRPSDPQSLRVLAWAALKTARGQQISQTRLSQLNR